MINLAGHFDPAGIARGVYPECGQLGIATVPWQDEPMPPDPTPILAKAPVVPVLTIERVEDAVPLTRALVAGGLPVVEVTLRTPAALDAARAIAAEVPDAVLGVGTVIEVPDIRLAVSAGARFLVSPGTPPDLAAALAKAPVPALPGCATVSEAMALAAHGFPVVKFFPAEAAGGVAFLKGIAAPLPHVKFCPTGGIDLRNAAAYLALPNVVAVGGSWVAPKEAIAAGDFARITALAREAAKLKH
jgi:2-dehydro-3-deoxyphosphogluconate aldolase/(4S)-4-hydroxy-2-oxoglutarate aldolase